MWQTFGAAVLTVIGVACLYGSWRDWIASHRWPVAIGWALLTASIWLWSRAAGAEFGTTLAIFVPALLAWVFVLHNIELRQQRHRVRTQRDTPEESAPTAPRSLLRHAGLLLVSVPLSAVAAALVSIAVAKWTPWTDLGEMVLAMILMPILWGCAAYWAIADSKMLRPAVSIAASALLSAALLYL